MMETNPKAMTDEAKLQTSPEATNDAVAEAAEEVKATVENVQEDASAETAASVEPAESPEPAVSESDAEPVAEVKAEESSEVPETPAETEKADEKEAETKEKTAENPENEAETDEEENPEHVLQVPDTKEGVLEMLKELAIHPEQSERSDLDALKQAFYKILKEEKSKAHAEYLKNGGTEEDFRPMPEPLEEEFKTIMNGLKEARAKLQEAVEKQKEVNLQRKKTIIEKIKQLATTPEDAGKNFDTFRQLQTEWKEIKPIAPAAANEIWKDFQFCVEQYYDLLKTNTALRDYDFKKNLEAKTKLCEEAEALENDKDIIHASRILQELHQEFRETGPVAQELREQLWTRFKAASSAVNKRHAQYFEQIKGKEEENLAKKTEICEKIESIETANLKNFSVWDNITKKIIELQAEWKTIGHATKKMNTKIYERYRAACDNFFSKKTEYFKAQRKVFAENAAKKTELCEEAEALKESQEWSKTTDQLVKLQQAWKEIGPTAYKVSNALWERFNTACNVFFEQKKKVFGDLHKEETDNLVKKKSILEQMKELAENAVDGAAEKVQDLMEQWNQTGHVPFKDKDKVFAAYREISDQLRDKFNLRPIGRRNAAPRRNNNGGRSFAQPQREGNGLFRQYEAKKAELNTYENNFSFLSAHSKKGNALIDSLQKKIDQLKAEAEAIMQKIKEQDKAAKDGVAPKPESAAPEAPAAQPAAATEKSVVEKPAEESAAPAEASKAETKE